MTIETRLRDALRRLDATPPEPGLADRALRQATRRRRTGLAVATATAAVVAAAAVAVPLTIGRADNRSAPATPGTVAPRTVGAYDEYLPHVTVKTFDHYLDHMVLNPTTGRYQKVNSLGGQNILYIVLAPDGRNALITKTLKGQHGAFVQWGVIPIVALLRADAGSVHWLPFSGDLTKDPVSSVAHAADMNPQWSPAADKILVPTGTRTSPAFRIYDVAGARLGPVVPVREPGTNIIFWGGTTNEVGSAPLNLGAPSTTPTRIDFLAAADGRRLRSVVVPGLFDDPAQIAGRPAKAHHLSQPTGQLRLDGNNRLLDDTVGLQADTPRGVPHTYSLRWLDTQRFAVYDDAQTPRVSVVDRAGRIVRTATLPRMTNKYGGFQLVPSSRYPSGVGIHF